MWYGCCKLNSCGLRAAHVYCKAQEFNLPYPHHVVTCTGPTRFSMCNTESRVWPGDKTTSLTVHSGAHAHHHIIDLGGGGKGSQCQVTMKHNSASLTKSGNITFTKGFFGTRAATQLNFVCVLAQNIINYFCIPQLKSSWHYAFSNKQLWCQNSSSSSLWVAHSVESHIELQTFEAPVALPGNDQPTPHGNENQ